MQVNIRAVVDDLRNINIKNVVFEAIMNAIEAKATKIDIKAHSSSLVEENQKPYIDKMEVIDNGEGFTEENLKSFEEYRSEHKKSLGCKGIGRFIYLKIFKNIKIQSQNVEIDFNIKGVNSKQIDAHHQLTNICFINPIQNCYINFDTITQDIREHFLAYFKLQKEEIQIDIYENENLKSSIKSTDIPHFETKDFEIKNYPFTISYIFGNRELKNEGFYAANKRVVIKNSELEQDRKYDLPKEKDIGIFYILESKYFDENVNSERNELQIYPKQKGSFEFQDLNWSEIYEELEKQLSKIYREHNFDIDSTIETNRKQSAIDLPYLGAYFADRNELNIKDMKDKAQQEFNNDKDFLRQKDKSSPQYETKLSKVTQAELAEYIFDRDKLIQKLKQSIEKGDIEEKVHNLFMTKRTSDDTQDYKSNNIWLFDDRFMSYDKVFSDMQIKDIFPKLHENILERPDILSIISNTYEKEKITDILLIEFKRPEANKDYFSKANQQLLSYASFINESFSQNFLRIWAYGFLKFDDEVLRAIRNDDFNQIYAGSKFPIFYKYNKTNNVIINFMDYNALICDAENRNKLFLDILRGKYLNKDTNFHK